MIKKISSILSCLVVLCNVQGAYAEETTVLMNKEIRWNGNALISAIDKAYQFDVDQARDAYNKALMYYSNPDNVEIGIKKIAYENLVNDKKSLIEWGVKQERFSLQQVLETCMSWAYLYTPETVCQKLLKSLIDIAGGELEEYTKGPAKEKKTQRCANHKLTFSGNQTKRDDEFIYSSHYNYTHNPPIGYECDPGGAEEACDEGDEVRVIGGAGFFEGYYTPKNTRTFRCVRGVLGDRWEAVEDDPNYEPPRGHA